MSKPWWWTRRPTKTTSERFWSFVDRRTPEECWLWLGGKSSSGYGQFWLRGKCISAHRVSFRLAKGHWPLIVTRHTCDQKACVNPHHLLEGTYVENMQDATTRGRMTATLGTRKLSWEQVRFLRQKYGLRLKYQKPTLTEIGLEFGISTAQVCALLNNKSYAVPAKGEGVMPSG